MNQMEQRVRRFLGDDKDLDDVWLFKQIKKFYQRLDDDEEEALVREILSDDDVIYLVEDRFFNDDAIDVFPVYYKGEEVARVGWKITTERVGGNIRHQSDTALSLKLRIQEQLGFPISSIHVKLFGASLGNGEMIRRYVNNFSTDIRIEVA